MFTGFFSRAAWILSFIATAASLTAEFVFNFDPCPLCLYQRYLMISIAILLFPVWGGHSFFKILATVSATIGMIISYDHAVLQDTPFESIPSLFSQLPDSYEGFSVFLTLPVASFITFSSILIFIVLSSIKE
ncbi:MAG: disulfide bond formation protein B [Verrucomicrobia bacterium]|nr:disulfide bond formation protein B [Verrucomicrobiota bacterium]NDE62722.1 disulfide bond formation protein B [Chlamydiota bacterium]